MVISQLLRDLKGLQDYEVMALRRRYYIEINIFDQIKSFALVQYIIPPNFMAISQILREL